MKLKARLSSKTRGRSSPSSGKRFSRGLGALVGRTLFKSKGMSRQLFIGKTATVASTLKRRKASIGSPLLALPTRMSQNSTLEEGDSGIVSSPFCPQYLHRFQSTPITDSVFFNKMFSRRGSQTLGSVSDSGSDFMVTPVSRAKLLSSRGSFSDSDPRKKKKSKLTARVLEYGLVCPDTAREFSLDIGDKGLSFLGRGRFGSVFLGNEQRKKIALKICPKPSCPQVGERNGLSLNHVNVVRTELVEDLDLESVGKRFKNKSVVDLLLSRSLTSSGLQMVLMEYAGRTSLQHLIDDLEQDLESGRRLLFASQIVSALHYCHRESVIHLDLKPSNIMIDKEHDVCKLVDFGCSRRAHVCGDTHHLHQLEGQTAIGTVAYTAPELFRHLDPTPKCDIYSFGILMWQLMTRETPYADIEQQCVIYRVNDRGARLRPEFGSHPMTPTDAEYARIAVSCWDHEPKDRPSTEHVHQMLANVSSP